MTKKFPRILGQLVGALVGFTILATQAQTIPAGIPGSIVNAESKAVFSYTDSCIAIGAHVGYNPESTKQTIQAVIGFIK